MSAAYVYILASKKNGTLYVGVTNDLIRRIYEHKHNVIKSFTSKYKIHSLVYYEMFDGIVDAIEREKYIKNRNRAWKIKLIEMKNRYWIDLYQELIS